MFVEEYHRRCVHRCVSPPGQYSLLWGDLHQYSVQRTSDIAPKSALDGDNDSITSNVLNKAIQMLTHTIMTGFGLICPASEWTKTSQLMACGGYRPGGQHYYLYSGTFDQMDYQAHTPPPRLRAFTIVKDKRQASRDQTFDNDDTDDVGINPTLTLCTDVAAYTTQSPVVVDLLSLGLY